MRIRRSEGVIERYGVTLSPGLSAENDIILTLLACPKGRRQQWLRKVLTLGLQNRQMSLPIIDNWTPPQGDPPPNKLVSIGLDRRAPEDLVILSYVESLPLVRRSQALRTLLIIGMQAPAKVQKKTLLAPRSLRTSQTQSFDPTANFSQGSTSSEKVGEETKLLNAEKKPKTSAENTEKTVVSKSRASKVRDNRPKVDDRLSAENPQNVEVHPVANDQTVLVRETENLIATKTAALRMQSLEPLDIDLSQFEVLAEKPVAQDWREALRGLMND